MVQGSVVASEAASPYPKLPSKELILPSGKLHSCHSPSIVELPDGTLFVVWYAQEPGDPDTDIWCARKPANTNKWTSPYVIADTPKMADKNPTLYLRQDGKLLLFWVVQKYTSKWYHGDTIHVKTSSDFGYTWDEGRAIGTPPGFLIRTNPVKLYDDSLVLPIYADWCNFSAVVISKDDGLTWGKPKWILPFLGIQPTIIQRSDSSLFTLMRTGAWPRQAWQAESKDNGNTWINQRVSSINNPNSSLEMATLRNGHIVLAFNDSKKYRYSFSLALSMDGGKTWPYVKMVECKNNHLYGYPDIIQDKQGLIHVIYSYDSETSIAHFVTDEEWIKSKR